jgi:hypothetical protein
MVQAPQRSAFSAPTLIRLLARLANVDHGAAAQASLSERLSEWLTWTDAIALSAALGGTHVADVAVRDFRSAQEESARVRASLAAAVKRHCRDAVSGGRREPGLTGVDTAPPDAAIDYLLFRQRFLSIQQTMETAVANLRSRLRETLAEKSPAMARLAAVDAVMERAISEREHALFAAVPELLRAYFERLRDAASTPATDGHASAGPAARPRNSWLDAFEREMQHVLLAELDIRFQPVEGLLSALRAR